MFKQPDRAALAARPQAQQQQQSNLRLKGFINVDGLRAVVEIDGKMTTLQAGEKKGDIQVLEITNTGLTLQRGRNRWTEPLIEPTVEKKAG